MRSLAHVEIVENILPIEGADRIELVKVLGWHVVQQKGTVDIGDKIIYIEIDSKVPNLPQFEFLSSRKFKVKTIKLKGTLSQGLIVLPKDFNLDENKLSVGQDLTSTLGITKIQTGEEKRLGRDELDIRLDRVKSRHKEFMRSPLGKLLMKHKFTRSIILRFFGGKKIKRKSFPDWVAKTDENRIENVPFELTNKSPLQVTEKIDGTSSTFAIDFSRKSFLRFNMCAPVITHEDHIVCSRNVRQLDEKQATYFDTPNVYWEIAHKYKIFEALHSIVDTYDKEVEHIVLQGEITGPKLQGNPYKLNENVFFGYNLIINGIKVDSKIAQEMLEQFKINWVPILDDNFICPDTMEEMKEFAEGKSVINPKVDREGCVYRDAENTRSFKNVANSYLLKHNS